MNRLLAACCLAVLTFTIPQIAGAQSNDAFNGPHVGVTLGYYMDRSVARASTVFSPTGYFAASSVTAINNNGVQKVAPNGFIGGGEVGVDWKLAIFMVGVEGDFSATNGRDQRGVTVAYPCCSPARFTLTHSLSTNWLLTARPRVGMKVGPVMAYITGGYALTHIKYEEVFTDTFAAAHENADFRQNKSGYTVGAGIGFATHGHYIVKVEYLYAGFGRNTVTSTNLTAFATRTAFPSNPFTASDTLHMHVVRAGFDYHF